MTPSLLRRCRSLTLLVAAGLIVGCAPRVVSEHYDSGQPKREGQVQDGMQVGTWHYYFSDGKIQATGDWRQDKQDGPWTYWFENGQVRAEGAYANLGERSGDWKIHHQDGKIASEGPYVHDRQDGIWRYWYSNGARCAVGTFINGVRSGLWRTYAADGRIAADAIFYNGVAVGPWRHPDGSVFDHHVPNGFRSDSHSDAAGEIWGLLPESSVAAVLGADPAPPFDGVVVVHHADGSGIASSTVLGHGAALVWYPDGSVAASGAIPFAHTDGVCTQPDAKGPATTASYADGRLQGDLPAQARELVGRIEDQVEQNRPLAASTQPAAAPAAPVADAAPAPATPAATPSEAAPAGSPTVSLPWFWTQSEEGSASQAIARYEHGGTNGTPDQSPQPQLPNFWTKHEEGSALGWIARYDNGGGEVTDPYSATAPPRPSSDRLVGQPLPQTRFLATNGGVLDLSSYQNQHRPLVVVVMRGFAGQVCLYCAAQTVALCKHIDEFHAAGAEVVVVYPGPAESAPAFLAAVQSLRKDPVPVPVALDVSLQLVRGLGVEDNLSKPTSLVLDRTGVVRYAYIGQTIADRPSAEQLLHAVRGIVE